MNKNSIAIIGLSFEFPGVNKLEDFWQALCSGQCLYQIPNEDNHPITKNNNHVNAWGGVKDIAGFDYQFFNYSYKEACAIDPQQRHLLKHSFWALENSGYANKTEQFNIGVFASASLNNYFGENLGGQFKVDNEDDVVLGNASDFLATRIAFKLSLTGPAFTVQSGCSSALVNLHQARIALLTKQCDIALAGAVSLSAPNNEGYTYQENGIRSKDGLIRPFDDDATGTVFTNGVAVLALKPYHAALRDNDNIIGVIASSAINNDGSQKASFTAPNIRQQAAVVNKALSLSQLDSKNICLIEAHGTGTSLGDPIEFAALNKVYTAAYETKPQIALQSVKANIGHLDTVSGFAGIIKSLLVLRYRLLPPQINFNKPNKALNSDNGCFYINKESKPLPKEGVLAAGVTALGIGGTNAHVILTTVPENRNVQSNTSPAILVSAKDKKALQKRLDQFLEFSESLPETKLASLAATTQFHLNSFDFRCAFYAENLDSLKKQIFSRLQSPMPEKCFTDIPLAFLFPGQGSQYVSMGKTLYEENSYFKSLIDQYFLILNQISGENFHEIVFEESENTTLYQTQHTQMALLGFEVALANFLIQKIGLKPTILIGHSLGEFSALVVSGVLSFGDAARLVYKRATLMSMTAPGKMLSVVSSHENIVPLLNDGVSVAAINSPNLLTVSGSVSNIEKLVAKLETKQIIYQYLPINHAFHSELLEPILDEFKSCFDNLTFKPPLIPIVSNATGLIHDENTLKNPDYWCSQLRGTVQFKAGIELIEQKYQPVYCEVGPGLTLTTFVKQIVSRHQAVSINTIPHPKDSSNFWSCFYKAFSQLWQAGINPKWENIRDNLCKGQPLSLPPYPYSEKNCWVIPTHPQEKSEPIGEPNVLKPYVKLWQQVSSLTSKQHEHPIVILHHSKFICETILSLLPDSLPIKTWQWEANETLKVKSLIKELYSTSNQPVVIINTLPLLETEDSDWKNFVHQQLLFQIELTKILEPNWVAKQIIVANKSSNLMTVATPEQTILQSMVKTINQEKSNLPSCLVDIMNNNWPSNLIKHLNFLIDSSHPILSLRDEQFFAEFFQVSALPKPIPINTTKQLKHIVIIGGCGHVGQQYIKALKSIPDIKLSLIQRRKKDEIVGQNTENELIAQLANDQNCRFIQADIGKLNSLEAALTNAIDLFGPVNLLIHAAGIEASEHYRLINDLCPDFIEHCFYAKRQGLYNIAQVTKLLPIQSVHVISSISSTLAGIGMYVYAGLHSFIDHFVERQNKQSSIPWTSINWEAWEFGNQDEEPETFQQGAFGSHLDQLAIRPEVGQQFIEQWLASPVASIIVASGSLTTRYQNWVLKQGLEYKINAVKDSRPDLTVAFVAPTNDNDKKLMAIWSDILGIEQIGINDNFFELGGHSLLALQLINNINTVFNSSLTIIDLFTYPTISKLGKFLKPGNDNQNVQKNSINRANSRKENLKKRRKFNQKVRSY
ncbi:SDR family NAD(P)-dependent oxidoreductase [Legionella israelensis]|uniref:SDR family NAD(P)-dependent oxidoreductase n=1 Tax=Legionella israelensis TaxID=454 RepID=A0AAX1EI74_9GAMM|nr:type I polyketide synthase [Legionella israelensis]QBR84764.1 SDR family NAD(P)-dependent oxidoreductase [Legionella israelensis]